MFPDPATLTSVLSQVQQPQAPAHNKRMPLELMMLLGRMETPKHYPGSAVTDPPSKLEQLVSDTHKEQTPPFVSTFGTQSHRDSHESHRAGTGQVLGNPIHKQLHPFPAPGYAAVC